MCARLRVVTQRDNPIDIVYRITASTFELSRAFVGIGDIICNNLYVKTKILQSATFFFYSHVIEMVYNLPFFLYLSNIVIMHRKNGVVKCERFWHNSEK